MDFEESKKIYSRSQSNEFLFIKTKNEELEKRNIKQFDKLCSDFLNHCNKCVQNE